MNNYYYLLKQLRQANEHSLHLSEIDEDFPCYYKSQTLQSNSLGQYSSGLWGLAFDVTFTVIKKQSLFVCLTDDSDIPFTNEQADKVIIKNY